MPVAVFTLMFQKRLLSCFGKGPRLLGERPGSAPPDAGHGNTQQLRGRGGDSLLSLPSSPGSVLACCSAANLRGRPPTFFMVHALGGAVVFLTDGVMVRIPESRPD